MKKVCRKCGKQKTLKLFTVRRACRDGRGSWCSQCARDHANSKYEPKNIGRPCAFCGRPLVKGGRKFCSRLCKSRDFFTRERWLMRTYNLTKEAHAALLVKQGGVCAVCKQPPGKTRHKEAVLAVDHCHSTERVRGLLCFKCNVVLGLVGDDPEILRRLIRYLRRK